MTSVKHAMTLEGLCSGTGLWNIFLLQANTHLLLRWNSIYFWIVVPARTEGWYSVTFLGWRPWGMRTILEQIRTMLYVTLGFSLPLPLSLSITLLVWSSQVSLFSSRGVLSSRQTLVRGGIDTIALILCPCRCQASETTFSAVQPQRAADPISTFHLVQENTRALERQPQPLYARVCPCFYKSTVFHNFSTWVGRSRICIQAQRRLGSMQGRWGFPESCGGTFDLLHHAFWHQC